MPPAAPARILVDGTKLLDEKTDGIKRYVDETIRALASVAGDEWRIDVELTTGVALPLSEAASWLAEGGPALRGRVPALLSPGSDNPLWRCRERLRAASRSSSGSSPGRLADRWRRARDQAHYQSLRLARSALRRWNKVRHWAVRSKAARYDLVHLTLPNTWRRFAHMNAQFVTTVHDLSHLVCPEFQTSSNNQTLRDGLAFSRTVGARYVAVSASTASQLIELAGVDPQLIDVVHEGVDRERFSPHVSLATRQRVADRYGLPTGPFLFCLGTVEPRKNLLGAVRAFRRLIASAPALDAHLLIAGAQGWGAQSDLDQEIAACNRIRRIGYVDERDLPALYALCRAFCYLSHYEGFGLPVLEAMSCGAPVLYAATSSLPEVAGDGGVATSPSDLSAIAASMRRLLCDDAWCASLAQRAATRALCFDWKRSAQRVLAAYATQLQASADVSQPWGTRRGDAA